MVVTSLATLVLAGLLFAVVSNWIPGSRSATNALFDQGTEWVKGNYRSALTCGLAVLTTAAAFAFVAASPPTWMPGMSSTWGRQWRGNRQQISSAWTVAFSTNNLTGGPVLVGVELDNGTHLRGVLDHWSTDLDEHCNRSLLLAGPLAIRSGATFEALEAHYVEVSAAQIKYLTAMYVTKDG